MINSSNEPGLVQVNFAIHNAMAWARVAFSHDMLSPLRARLIAPTFVIDDEPADRELSLEDRLPLLLPWTFDQWSKSMLYIVERIQHVMHRLLVKCVWRIR